MIQAFRIIEQAYKRSRQWAQEIADGQELSPSRITSFKICGLLFYFKHHLKMKFPPAARMVFGTAGHAAVNTDLTVKAETGETVKDTLLTELFTDTLHENMREVDRKMEREPLNAIENEFRDKWTRLFPIYRGRVEPKLNPKFVEHRIEYPIEIVSTQGKPQLVKIVNHLDVITKNREIRDHKFRARANGNTDIPTLQMASYALAYEYETGKPPKSVQHDTYVALKREAKMIPQRMDALDPQARVALTLDVQTILRASEAGVFPIPIRGQYPCTPSWCPAWKICPYGGGGRKANKFLPSGQRIALP